MFKLLLPRAFGGYELKPIDFIQCVEAIAEGDASVAWCMNQGFGCSMAAAYMASEVAGEIWGGARDVVAWGQGPGAKARRTEGGWRVTGTWRFASGSRHATWLGGMCPHLGPTESRWYTRTESRGGGPSYSAGNRRRSTTFGR
jgi:indole-3-acetate monooxygenase